MVACIVGLAGALLNHDPFRISRMASDLRVHVVFTVPPGRQLSLAVFEIPAPDITGQGNTLSILEDPEQITRFLRHVRVLQRAGHVLLPGLQDVFRCEYPCRCVWRRLSRCGERNQPEKETREERTGNTLKPSIPRHGEYVLVLREVTDRTMQIGAGQTSRILFGASPLRSFNTWVRMSFHMEVCVESV